MTLMINTGAILRPVTRAPITREQLKAYSDASGDFNQIHLDDEVARKAGLNSVIAHGMLSMAFMGEYVEAYLRGRGTLVSFTSRFKAMTYPGDVITVGGTIKFVEGRRVTLSLETRNERGEVTALGTALIELQRGE